MYLLDTNILSEFVRRTPNPAVVSRARSVPASQLSTSVICVMELRYGSMRRADGQAFWRRLDREILGRIRIEPFDSRAAEAAGDILAALEAGGQVIGVEDIQIAATGLARGLVIVTANTRHFNRISGLTVQDWTVAPA